MFCGYCGTKCSDGDVFCFQCGSPLQQSVPAVNTDVPQEGVVDTGSVLPAHKGPVMVAPRLPVQPKASPNPEPEWDEPFVKAAPKRRFVSPIPVTEKKTTVKADSKTKKTLPAAERASMKKMWNKKFYDIFQERWEGILYSPWFLALTVILTILSVYNLYAYFSPALKLILEAESVTVLSLGFINIFHLIGGAVTSAGLCIILIKKAQISQLTNGFSALSAGLAFFMLSAIGTAGLVIVFFVELWDGVEYSIDALLEMDVFFDSILLVFYAVFVPLTIGKLRKISKNLENSLSLGIPDPEDLMSGIWMPLVVVGLMVYYYMQGQLDYMNYLPKHHMEIFAQIAIYLLSAILVFSCRSEMLQLEEIKYALNKEFEEKYK